MQKFRRIQSKLKFVIARESAGFSWQSKLCEFVNRKNFIIAKIDCFDFLAKISQ